MVLFQILKILIRLSDEAKKEMEKESSVEEPRGIRCYWGYFCPQLSECVYGTQDAERNDDAVSFTLGI